MMRFVSCGVSFLVIIRESGPTQAKQRDFLRCTALPSQSVIKAGPRDAVGEQLVEERKCVNCEVTEGEGKGDVRKL